MKFGNIGFTSLILLLLSFLLTCDTFIATPARDLQLRSKQSPDYLVAEKGHLDRRGSCCSAPKPDPEPDYGPPYQTDPSVDDLKNDLNSLGTIKGKRSVFYTGMGGSDSQGRVQAWGCSELESKGEQFIIFKTLTPEGYLQKMSTVFTLPRQATRVDLWGKRISWAWAELAEGDTYIAIPDGQDPAPDSTWTLYEYPALQRNTQVTHIFRVDVDTNSKTTMWSKGDPVNTDEPGPYSRSGPPPAPGAPGALAPAPAPAPAAPPTTTK